MKALVLGGRVCDVQKTAFPAHSSMKWFACAENVAIGWRYDGEFSPPPPEDSRLQASPTCSLK